MDRNEIIKQSLDEMSRLTHHITKLQGLLQAASTELYGHKHPDPAPNISALELFTLGLTPGKYSITVLYNKYKTMYPLSYHMATSHFSRQLKVLLGNRLERTYRSTGKTYLYIK